MNRYEPFLVREIEVIDSPAPYPEPQLPIITVMAPAPATSARSAFFAGVAFAIGLAATGALVWVLNEAQHRQETLQQAMSDAQSLHLEQQRTMQQVVLQLQRNLDEHNEQIAALQAERAMLAESVLAAPSKAARPGLVVNKATPDVSTHFNQAASIPDATSHQAAADGSAINPEAVAAAEPDSPLAEAIEATQQLASTELTEPPSLETIKAHIKAGDPLVATNKEAARADKSPIMRFLTNPIFIDSAVLGTSLLVPPSLPLTLAQSRLGRALTTRAMKKADLDKSVAGHVARDVGNMPITQKKSKKK